MTIHLARIRSVVAVATVAVGLNLHDAAAQYAPYNAPQYAAPGYPYPVAGQPGFAPSAPMAYTASVPQYLQPTAPPVYPSAAQQQAYMAQNTNGEVLAPPAPAVDATYGSNGQTAYPTTDGCNTCNNGYSGGYGDCNGYPDYGVGNYFGNPLGCRTWFGGIYGLWMERDDPGYTRFTVEFDMDSVAYPYYPPTDVTILSTADVEHDFREGVEVRFGSTFSVGSSCDDGCGGAGYGCGSQCGSDGCGCCPPQDYAWEFGYWALADDRAWLAVVDEIPNDDVRVYGMMPFTGLEYNGGSGYRPVNDYYDAYLPKTDDRPPASGDIRVIAQRVRANFTAQNLELNILRLPMCACGSMCGSSGGCGDGCGSTGCGSGCGTDCGSGCGCESACCAPAFSMTGLCGVRYMRLDDDFEYANEFTVHDGTSYPDTYDGFGYTDTNELFYNIAVDNQLAGFQLGANMNYCVSCKCDVFWDTNFGLYNNHIDHYQRLYSGGGGTVRYVGSQETFAARSNKDDIAFIGEMRLGGAYRLTCNCRAVLAYRAVAISGVALTTDQVPASFSDSTEVALIDSNGSIVMHGVQAGVEFKY